MLNSSSFSETWPVVSLGEAVNFLDNLRKPVKASDRVEGEYLYYGANGIQGTINDFIFDEPLLLLAEDGGHFGNPNRDIAYIAKGKYWVNNHAHVLKPNEGLDLNFLYRVLQRYDVTPFIKGATRAKLTKGDAARIPIPLPPLAEQQRIAAILDKADAIRRKRQQAIQLADGFLRAVFLDMFGDPVTNPKGFPVGTIRDLVDTANYGSSAKASETEGEFPMLRMGNITYSGAIDFSGLKYIDLSKKEQPKYLVEKGDLLFNRTNSKELVGKTAVYDREEKAAIAGYLIRVRMNEKGNSHYVAGYLNSAHGKSTLQAMCKSIVGMANINAQEMQDIQILLPPVELQVKYAEIVEAVKERIVSHNESKKNLEGLFNSLSQKAFRGEL